MDKFLRKIFSNFFLYLFVIVFFILLFLYSQKEPDLYIFPENPKQGDTVFIKAKARLGEITGTFEGKKINFFKERGYKFIAFLGIDAKLEPKSYKIYIDFPGKGIIEKEIKVEQAEFSSFKMPFTKALEEKGYTEKKVLENMVKKDTPALNKVLSVFTDKPYFNKPFSYPLLKIEKRGLSFGALVKSLSYDVTHFGADLKADIGQEVFAVNRGQVVLVEELFDYGKTIIIDHGLGIFSLYLHLSEFRVSVGQIAEQNQVIGLSGNTGYSTAPHLHFSIRNNGARVDPISFIEATKKAKENLFLADIKEAVKSFLDNYF